jgi:predicted oxidoreductase
MMQMVSIGTSDLKSSRLVHGAMRMKGDGSAEARRRSLAAVHAAAACGINHFDHADIYGGGGECERIFSQALREDPGLRDRILITSKCGIRGADSPHPGDPRRFDFSREHILASVEGSLHRLGIETLDILLLHRPDYLCDPQEVAAAFDQLLAQGKVRHFGVSNFSVSQVALLQAICRQPIVMNQVEFNIHRIAPMEDGVFDQCMRERITAQSWCPLGGVAYPAWDNTFGEVTQAAVDREVAAQAEKYGCDKAALILAWILKHPAGILPVLGSMNPQRIEESVKALDIPYTREDWYRLIEARKVR